MAVDTQQLSKVMLSDESGAVPYPVLVLENCIALLMQLESLVHQRFHEFSSDLSDVGSAQSHFVITEVWVFNVGFPVVNAFNLIQDIFLWENRSANTR